MFLDIENGRFFSWFFVNFFFDISLENRVNGFMLRKNECRGIDFSSGNIDKSCGFGKMNYSCNKKLLSSRSRNELGTKLRFLMCGSQADVVPVINIVKAIQSRKPTGPA